MIGLRPFRALRFAAAENLAETTAPPYDAIAPGEDRDLLEAPHNIVHLTLAPADRAAATLDAWRAAGTLLREERPALWLEDETFEHDGRTFTRRILYGLVGLDPARGAGPVLFHEETYKPVVGLQEAVLESTHANLDATLLLYEDEDAAVTAALADAANAAVTFDFADAHGRRHVVRRLTDPALLERLEVAFRGRPLLIADGHHRMEAAMRHAADGGPERPGVETRLAGLVRADDPGILLLPTFKIIPCDPADGLSVVRRSAEELGFPVRAVPRDAADEVMMIDRATLVAVPAGGGDALAVVCRGGARGAATFAHERIAMRLGAPRPDVRRTVAAAVEALSLDGMGLALLQAAPRVDDVRVAADAGLPMPPKSTCFHPKLLSGLLLRELDPGAEA